MPRNRLSRQQAAAIPGNGRVDQRGGFESVIWARRGRLLWRCLTCRRAAVLRKRFSRQHNGRRRLVRVRRRARSRTSRAGGSSSNSKVETGSANWQRRALPSRPLPAQRPAVRVRRGGDAVRASGLRLSPPDPALSPLLREHSQAQEQPSPPALLPACGGPDVAPAFSGRNASRGLPDVHRYG